MDGVKMSFTHPLIIPHPYPYPYPCHDSFSISIHPLPYWIESSVSAIQVNARIGWRDSPNESLTAASTTSFIFSSNGINKRKTWIIKFYLLWKKISFFLVIGEYDFDNSPFFSSIFNVSNSIIFQTSPTFFNFRLLYLFVPLWVYF